MTTFEAAMLPDDEKRDLCEKLLTEFGVDRWRSTASGELIHSCPIPGGHRNGDRNPSASLNYRKLTFNCFGCGSRGGITWFMATCRGEPYEGVRAWLEEATGTGGREMAFSRLMEILDAYEAKTAPPPPIPRYNPAILQPWTKWEIIHPYMTGPAEEGCRECREEVCREMQIGYADEYSMGPSRPTQERIVIPLFWRGELVGWQARKLYDEDEPKYIFSPDFPRDRVLYAMPPGRLAVVVESPLSVLRHRHHVPEMTSTYGAEVTEVQIRLLHRYDDVVLWYDNDEAGWKATEQVGRELEGFVNVWAVDNPYDADPAEVDDTTAKELIGQAVPFSVWERPT